MSKELIKEYAQDWAETEVPWTRWEWRSQYDVEWQDCTAHPLWHTLREFRRKRITQEITKLRSTGNNFYLKVIVNDVADPQHQVASYETYHEAATVQKTLINELTQSV